MVSINDQLIFSIASSGYALAKTESGAIYEVVFSPAEDENCEDSFHTEKWTHCWNDDGTSVTNSDLDIVAVL